MSRIVLPAHFDGERILLDEPFDLKPETRLIVTVLTAADAEDAPDAWPRLSLTGLEGAYGANEPEYTVESVSVPNPDYAGR